MTENNGQSEEAMTQADVHRQAAQASAEDVAKSLASPAPSSHVESTLQKLADRLAMIERTLGLLAPVFDAGAAIMPGAAPVLSRLPAIERALEGVLTALAQGFGSKLPELPPPGSATAAS